MDTVNKHLLTAYLDRVSHELEAAPDDADQVLRELESHLELALLDAQVENPKVGMADILTRFGTVHQIGQALRRVHGRATWPEALLAVLPLLLFGWISFVLPTANSGSWLWPISSAIFALVTIWAWRSEWPLWWWAWLGWVPFVLPNTSHQLLWSVLFYSVLLALVIRRDWLEATLSIYPLSTVWAYRFLVLNSREVQNVGWATDGHIVLLFLMVVVWSVLLVRMLRTLGHYRQVARVFSNQVAISLFSVLTVSAARLWPTYPLPYTFRVSHFLFATVPYALYHGLPYLLFLLLALLPALISVVREQARRRPPSRPVVNG